MIAPLVTMLISATVSAGVSAVSGGGRRGYRQPRRIIVRRTSEAAVQDLIAALRREKALRAAADAEVRELRTQLEIARELLAIG